MSKEMEKLMKEIRKPWCQDCKKGGVDEAVGWPDKCGPNEQFACDERIRQSITLILSAVQDGLPLPDEVGRGPIIDREGHRAILLPDGEWIAIYEGSPCTFIAFHEEREVK